mgnify:FL=1
MWCCSMLQRTPIPSFRPVSLRVVSLVLSAGVTPHIEYSYTTHPSMNTQQRVTHVSILRNTEALGRELNFSVLMEQ